MARSIRGVLVAAVAAAALNACTHATQKEEVAAVQPVSEPEEPGVVHPALWPAGASGVGRDAAIDAEAARLLSQMTTEEKVGQTIQADIASVSPQDVRTYHLGAILNGGNSGPHRDDRAPPPAWLKAADEFFEASLPAAPDRPRIPVIWGTDSMHGNSNIAGATIFPHNIGIGAARDPELVREIGRITAIETRVTGADWVFAPVVAVARDDRWGRTYESYSEDPALVSENAAALVEGLQGRPGDPDFLRGGHVIATAKHFIGDGGTDRGRDQGDTLADEATLRDLFAPPYEAAIAAGVQAVMASYSSWQGRKLHANRPLLSDVLVGRLGFDGIVVGDWNGYAQVPGCSFVSCPAVYNAGMDLVMAPDNWRGLYRNTLAQVQSGEIPMARIDEAVSRILRVKLRAGVMDAGPPSTRPYAGRWDELGSPGHRAVARRAVRESLVLLKNDGAILPLAPTLDVLVAGDGADDLGKQCGGWTISWQGTGNSRADFPGGQTIFEGIREQVQAAGGTATLSADGSYSRKPDVAIVVFGENPYAEFQGDRDDLAFRSPDLETMRGLRAKGVPVVAVFLSGRPLYVTREINAANAFVAAWLPGSEGGGVADMLFRRADGTIAYDFRGRLSFSWPRAPGQTPLNVPRPSDPPEVRAAYDPLFAFGYGLDYAHPRDLGPLPEAGGSTQVAARETAFRAMR
ncbi:MAG TPA: glycoside hydrolase family 3 protein [Rhizomicrobium sp.]|nr:glycoside hydrolase family 3 protein [Rhizomicrobium sp.]